MDKHKLALFTLNESIQFPFYFFIIEGAKGLPQTKGIQVFGSQKINDHSVVQIAVSHIKGIHHFMIYFFFALPITNSLCGFILLIIAKQDTMNACG